MMYLPSMDHHYAQAVLARTKDDRSGAAEALAAVVHEADPRAAVFQVESADAALHALSAGQRFSAVLLAAGGCGGLLLAMLGLYGVVSYAVTQRTREIGIRHALGAARRDILRLFLRDGLIASAIGIAAGVAIGVEGVRAVGYVIYDAPHADVVSCTIVTLALSGAVFFACLLPALRATRVDPVDALRTL
jgi:putative ABC transport system permease protein